MSRSLTEGEKAESQIWEKTRYKFESLMWVDLGKQQRKEEIEHFRNQFYHAEGITFNNRISPHLTSLIDSATLRKMTYNKIHFTMGYLKNKS